MVQFTKTKNDESAFMIQLVFDKERLPKPWVVPYQRNTNTMPAKKIELMVIHVPYPFSFDSTKVVPWNYNVVVYVGDNPMVLKASDLTNITGTSGIIQSGRIVSP